MKIKIGKFEHERPDFNIISDADFEKMKNECYLILTNIAKKKKKPIGYKKLALSLSSIQYPFDADPMFRVLANVIGELSVEECVKNHPLISALVVNDTADSDHQGLPGNGFFELAGYLGRNTGDRITFWADELNRIYSTIYNE
jgi:hypothetical protein